MVPTGPGVKWHRLRGREDFWHPAAFLIRQRGMKPNLRRALAIGHLAGWPPQTLTLARELDEGMGRDLPVYEWVALLDGHAMVHRKPKHLRESGVVPKLLGGTKNGDD